MKICMARCSFIEHHASVDKCYLEQLRASLRFGLAMIRSGAACFVHGVLHTTLGSRTVSRLHDRMVTNRSGVSATAQSFNYLPEAGHASFSKSAALPTRCGGLAHIEIHIDGANQLYWTS
jgi:hypothetical protein